MTNNALSRIQYIFYCNTYTAANYKFLPWGNFLYILDNINKTTKKTINKNRWAMTILIKPQKNNQ